MGPEEVIAACNALQSHSTSNVTSISQKAALAALTGPQAAVGEMLGEYRRLAAQPGPGGPAERAGGERPRLTERETEVLRLVAKGLSYRQIAERLVLSHRTVQNHVQNTLGKLQLHNRVELVRYAIERGLDAD